MQAALIGALNGVIGDYLQNTKNPLAVKLGFHQEGKLVADLIDGNHNYTASFPEWNGDVCVFIHGAAGSESAWQKRVPDLNDTDEKVNWSYGHQLYKEFKMLPVYVRYNSGLHISQNGRLLSRLFEAELNHPNIKRVFIIGHSMGGLVFRSACHFANDHDHHWMSKIEQAYYLGSPHLGAPLEKFGAWTQSILRKVDHPYTQLAAKLINLRSNGIKDLRHGYLTAEEWEADQKHEFPVNNRTVHFHLETAQHLLVAATWHSDPESFVAEWFGDIMVRKSSATSACKENKFNVPVAEDDVFITGGHHHIKLMQSEEVYYFIRSKVSELMTSTVAGTFDS